MWKELKNRNFFGYKFRRQHPFTYRIENKKQQFFIADFYCAEKNLIVELDGRVHDFQKHYDANRDKILAELGLKTLRFSNDELETEMDVVMGKIFIEMQA